MWCEDPKKVPRKFRPREVHGADIRKQGSRTESAGKEQSGATGEAGNSQDAAKVCVCIRIKFTALIRSVGLSAELMNRWL